MTVSLLSLSVLLLAAAPEGLRHPEPDAPTNKEERTRSVWVPSGREPVEVFVGVFLDLQWTNATPVSFPAPVKHVEADPSVIVLSEHSDVKASTLRVAARLPIPTGLGAEVRVTLVDESKVTLRLVTRPNVQDALLTLRKRPLITPEETARLTQERLAHCKSETERIAERTQLIAERGAFAVIHTMNGNGYAFKQTNGLELSFVDVVHDNGISYATLNIKNRSEQDWAVNLEQFRLLTVEKEIQLISRAARHTVIPPKKESRVVLSYVTPDAATLTAFVDGAELIVGMIP
jgi:hypothetical protein